MAVRLRPRKFAERIQNFKNFCKKYHPDLRTVRVEMFQRPAAVSYPMALEILLTRTRRSVPCQCGRVKRKGQEGRRSDPPSVVHLSEVDVLSTVQGSVIPVLAFAAFTVSAGEDESTSDERHDDNATDEAPGPRWDAGGGIIAGVADGAVAGLNSGDLLEHIDAAHICCRRLR